MSPATISALFAIVLIAINWHWSHTLTQSNVTTSVSVDGASIAALFCAGALIYLSIRLTGLLRAILDQSIRVPRDVKLIIWWPLLLLLPLFTHVDYSLSQSENGTTISNTCGYGSDHATLLVLLAAGVIIAFQAFSSLKKYRPDAPLYRGADSPIIPVPAHLSPAPRLS
jgi:hypothetical protein